MHNEIIYVEGKERRGDLDRDPYFMNLTQGTAVRLPPYQKSRAATGQCGCTVVELTDVTGGMQRKRLAVFPRSTPRDERMAHCSVRQVCIDESRVCARQRKKTVDAAQHWPIRPNRKAPELCEFAEGLYSSFEG